MTVPFVPLSRVLALLVAVCASGAPATAEDSSVGRNALDRGDLREAESYYGGALLRDALDGMSRCGLAEICIAETRPQEALEHLALARLSSTPVRPGYLHHLRAEALLLLRRTQSAQDAVRTGRRVDPRHPRLLETAAKVAFRLGDTARAGRLYRKAVDIEPLLESANMRLGGGFSPAATGTPWRDPPQRKGFDRALSAWAAYDLDLAQERFVNLLKRWPDSFKFRLGLGVVLREQRLYHQTQRDTPARYMKLPAPDVDGLAELIPQWNDLDEDARHVIRVSAAPAAKWIPVMIKKGARHDILSWDALLTEAPERSRYVHTFDGRRWRQLRGIGGKYAATGVEKLRLASWFAFNTFAHELAHQVLTFGFDAALSQEVQRLYVEAVEQNRCLDYYAASNVDEYFAQGFEAFVSLRKAVRLRETARHTRDELKRRDPALYAFLERTLDWSHETDASMRAFRAVDDQGKR